MRGVLKNTRLLWKGVSARHNRGQERRAVRVLQGTDRVQQAYRVIQGNTRIHSKGTTGHTGLFVVLYMAIFPTALVGIGFTSV